jgi:hypothetical protein
MSYRTAAVKDRVPAGMTMAPGGAIETATHIWCTLTLSNFVGSACEVAVTFTVASVGITEGAL